MTEKVLDLTYLKESSLEDKDFVTDMMHLYLKNIVLYTNDLDSAIEGGDLKEIQEVAHKFKSTLAIMGGHKLVSILAGLEAMENIDMACISSYKDGKTLIDLSIQEAENYLSHPETI